jgi:hypothetical protein
MTSHCRGSYFSQAIMALCPYRQTPCHQHIFPYASKFAILPSQVSVSHRTCFTCRYQTPTMPDITRFAVLLGIHHLDSDHEMPHVVRQLSTIVRHPQYLGTMNDIALLRLTQPVTYSVVIRPICLPPAAGKFQISSSRQHIINLYLTLHQLICKSSWFSCLGFHHLRSKYKSLTHR